MTDRLAAGFVLGFHGCDRAVGEALLAGAAFEESKNAYDWLGRGAYFWEANPQRGLAFAEELRRRKPGKINDPAVVGAVIDLGVCLDLTTQSGIQQVRGAYDQLAEMSGDSGYELPKNGPDLLRRNLDCAVINWLHTMRKDAGENPVDTVRGVFVEGKPVFPESGFYAKTHIQIAVRNAKSIKGVFRVHEGLLQT